MVPSHYTVKRKCNLYSAKSTAGKVIAVLKEGQKVDSSGTTDRVGSITWVYLQYVNGHLFGWAKLSDLTEVKTEYTTKKNSKTTSSVTTAKGNSIYKHTTKTVDQYLKALMSSSKMDNILDKTNRLFGAPHQFLGTVDTRYVSKSGATSKLGRAYINNILGDAPILYIVPGIPNFLPDSSDGEKSLILDALKKVENLASSAEKTIKDILADDESDIKYYDFTPTTADYYKYVNMLCRMMSIYLSIDNLVGPNGKTTYDSYLWQDYQWNQLSTGASTTSGKNKKIWEWAGAGAAESFDRTFKQIADAVTGKYYYIQFLVNANVSFSETMSNSTSQSKLQSRFDSYADEMREANFLMNSATLGSDISSGIASFAEGMADFAGDNGIIGRMLNSASTTIQGGSIIFPELWRGSEFDKSYSISIDLISPYGDLESIYLNIFVPLAHLIALVLPRQSSANTYTSPYLVKAFALGFFSCDMGIITSLTIDKGGEGYWSSNGLPMKVSCTLQIKELFTAMAMVKTEQPGLFMKNTSLMNFLAVTCGIDITKPNTNLKIKTFISIYTSKVMDMPASIGDKIAEAVAGIMQAFYWNK